MLNQPNTISEMKNQFIKVNVLPNPFVGKAVLIDNVKAPYVFSPTYATTEILYKGKQILVALWTNQFLATDVQSQANNNFDLSMNSDDLTCTVFDWLEYDLPADHPNIIALLNHLEQVTGETWCYEDMQLLSHALYSVIPTVKSDNPVDFLYKAMQSETCQHTTNWLTYSQLSDYKVSNPQCVVVDCQPLSNLGTN